MVYGVLADLTVVIHLGFILFVFTGGLLVLRWRPVAYFHIPAAMWGTLVELKRIRCPLTPLENWLRAQDGSGVYEGAFINQYIMPIVYPPGLTPAVQIYLGAAVLAINLAVYGYLLWRKKRTDAPT